MLQCHLRLEMAGLVGQALVVPLVKVLSKRTFFIVTNVLESTNIYSIYEIRNQKPAEEYQRPYARHWI